MKRHVLCAGLVLLALCLDAQGRQPVTAVADPLSEGKKPATVTVTADVKLAGKKVVLTKGTKTVAEARLEESGGAAKATLAFDPLPWGLRGDRLDVVIDGVKQAAVDAPLVLVGMRGNPPRQEILDALRAPDRSVFPMIDRFGQYMHRDWPGKIHSARNLAERIEQETRDLRAHPGPVHWDKFGGWAAGPKLRATGFFRVEKRGEMWWLVDPEGRLFWSHGIDCVRSSTAATPITDRRHYFQDLPEPGSALAAFYGNGSWAPHGYYQHKGRYRTYNFSAANLLRKYGDSWKDRFAQTTHRRLRSWGMNTIGNWSDPEIYLQRKTPYVATISFHSRRIEGSSGYWGKFPDPFDPGFRRALAEQLARENGRAAGDPWCIGFFVQNELAWGDDVSLAVGALASPADQPAKLAFVEDLKAKYETIDKLNAAWGTGHTSWKALLASRTPPEKEKARADLTAFYTRLAETYFRTCREEVKRAAPNQLYLGCRFAWVNDRAARAAAKFCDVVGYNRYRYDVADFRLPEGVDMPVIIGEFHFGALDRGLFHPGLRKTTDQNGRAARYKSYVAGALENPQIVGTHWFQYGDQAATGRADGENYQIGFVDVCDTPYVETIRACREIGYRMYERRSGAAR